MADSLGPLLRSTHTGDESAAAGLWAALAPTLMAVARAVTREESAAHDAVQTAWLNVLKSPRSTIAGVGDTTAYMAAAVRHAALNARRESSRRDGRESAVVLSAPAPTRATEGTTGLERRERTSQLQGAIDSLPGPQREVVLLKHAGGGVLSFDQLAAILAEPRSTVFSRYQAALVALRAMLAEVTTGAVSLPGCEPRASTGRAQGSTAAPLNHRGDNHA